MVKIKGQKSHTVNEKYFGLEIKLNTIYQNLWYTAETVLKAKFMALNMYKKERFFFLQFF